MSTQDSGLEARYGQAGTPILFFWQPRGAGSHCAWLLGHTYISAVPDRSRAPQGLDAYTLKRKQALADDMVEFHNTPLRVLLPGLNLTAMAQEGQA